MCKIFVVLMVGVPSLPVPKVFPVPKVKLKFGPIAEGLQFEKSLRMAEMCVQAEAEPCNPSWTRAGQELLICAAQLRTCPAGLLNFVRDA